MSESTGATTVKQIESLPNDAIIYKIEGKITHLWERKSGTTQKGKDWSFQNGTFKDATGEMKFTLAGCPELSQSWRNKEVTIEAKKGNKGWSGLYAKDEKNEKDENRRIIWITPTGMIESAGKAEPPPQEPPKQQSKPPQEENKKEPGKTVAQDPKGNPKSVISKVAQMYLEIDAAARIVKGVLETRDGKEMPREEFLGLRTSLLITIEKDKIYFGLGGLTEEHAKTAKERERINEEERNRTNRQPEPEQEQEPDNPPDEEKPTEPPTPEEDNVPF